MRWFLIAMLCLGLAACGSEEAMESEGMAAERAPASAAPAAPEAARAPMESAPAAAAPASEHPDVQGCLDLVRDAQFAQAVPVCVRALKVDPENEQVQQALETAKDKVGSLPGSAGEAAGDADEAAKGMLGEAGKQLP
jgi:hypothetical protein